MTPRLRLAVLMLGVAALAGAAMALPLESLPERVARVGLLAPVAGVFVGAALLVALVPRTPVSLACGALFGALTGAVCAVAVTVVAAVVTFGAGRLLGREALQAHLAARLGGRGRTALRRLEGWVSGHGIMSVATVRAVPLGPHALAGYAYGASDVRVRDYLLGTAVAAGPSAVSYAVLGAAVVGPGGFEQLSLVPVALGVALSAGLILRAYSRKERQRVRAVHGPGTPGGGAGPGGGPRP